jgi:uncharacterized protein (DUF1778 family)
MSKHKNKALIEISLDSETRLLAERASAATGFDNMNHFLTSLIREHAPRILAQQNSIELTNSDFDRFRVICEDETLKPSEEILEAVKRLDNEGLI